MYKLHNGQFLDFGSFNCVILWLVALYNNYSASCLSCSCTSIWNMFCLPGTMTSTLYCVVSTRYHYQYPVPCRVYQVPWPVPCNVLCPPGTVTSTLYRDQYPVPWPVPCTVLCPPGTMTSTLYCVVSTMYRHQYPVLCCVYQLPWPVPCTVLCLPVTVTNTLYRVVSTRYRDQYDVVCCVHQVPWPVPWTVLCPPGTVTSTLYRLVSTKYRDQYFELCCLPGTVTRWPSYRCWWGRSAWTVRPCMGACLPSTLRTPTAFSWCRVTSATGATGSGGPHYCFFVVSSDSCHWGHRFRWATWLPLRGVEWFLSLGPQVLVGPMTASSWCWVTFTTVATGSGGPHNCLFVVQELVWGGAPMIQSFHIFVLGPIWWSKYNALGTMASWAP